MDPRKATLSLVAIVTLATGSVALAGDRFGPSFGAAAANCPTTSTASGVIERDGLRAVLGRKGIIAASADDRPEPPGTYPGSIGRDGVIGSKVLWRREPNAFGELRVVARHRMAPNRPVRGSYDNHLGPESTVVPGAIKFTREGCWRITVTSGSARLTAVLWVVNIDAGRNDRFIDRELHLGREARE